MNNTDLLKKYTCNACGSAFKELVGTKLYFECDSFMDCEFWPHDSIFIQSKNCFSPIDKARNDVIENAKQCLNDNDELRQELDKDSIDRWERMREEFLQTLSSDKKKAMQKTIKSQENLFASVKILQDKE